MHTSLDFRGLVYAAIDLINYILPFIVSIALVAFLWGVKNYVASGGDEKKVGEGRDMMVYGIIGLAVMVSVWGLVGIVTSTFFPSSLHNTYDYTPQNIMVTPPGGMAI
jgi:hypothetical protein